jgi:glycerol-3-phosphate acyltransferase PlsY
MNGAVLVLLAAFLLGSIPFGVFYARIFGGEDIRAKGSGNIGATNVSRVVGFWPAGFLTFLSDGLKGTISVLLAGSMALAFVESWAVFDTGAWAPGSLLLQWAAGACGVIGHCFSPWLKFRGGKGVATAFGAFAVLSPWAALAGALGFLVTFLSTRVGSLGSLSGLLILMMTHWVLPSFEGGGHLLFGAVMVFIILARHEKNLDALLESRENRFS